MDILLTAFRDTSAELLLKAQTGFKTIFLPNDKAKDSEILINALKKESADYVFCFGQKPLIRNKITIETTARDGETYLHTAFDCERMRALFENMGISAKISHNAGTSFCNRLYYNTLNYIARNNSKSRAVFIHIPFAKNIDDFSGFADRVFGVIRLFFRTGGFLENGSPKIQAGEVIVKNQPVPRERGQARSPRNARSVRRP